jgi:hypothetical protein
MTVRRNCDTGILYKSNYTKFARPTHGNSLIISFALDPCQWDYFPVMSAPFLSRPLWIWRFLVDYGRFKNKVAPHMESPAYWFWCQTLSRRLIGRCDEWGWWNGSALRFACKCTSDRSRRISPLPSSPVHAGDLESRRRYTTFLNTDCSMSPAFVGLGPSQFSMGTAQWRGPVGDDDNQLGVINGEEIKQRLASHVLQIITLALMEENPELWPPPEGNGSEFTL